MDEQRFLQVCTDFGACVTPAEVDDMWRTLDIPARIAEMSVGQAYVFLANVIRVFGNSTPVLAVAYTPPDGTFIGVMRAIEATGLDQVNRVAAQIGHHAKTRFGETRPWRCPTTLPAP